MLKNEKDTFKLLALAGVFQAAYLVNRLGKFGIIDKPALLTQLNSLLLINADDVSSIYGNNKNNLMRGLKQLTIQLQLGKNVARDPDILRYVLSLIMLEKKLKKSQSHIHTIQTGIEKIKKKLEYFPIEHPTIQANLAGLYTDTIGTLAYRIQVSGERAYLNKNDTMNTIRALLLSGIRFVVLWEQLGGSRLDFLIHRKKIISNTAQLLTNIEKEEIRID